MNILTVDDHPTNLKLLRAILEAQDFTVFAANDGVAALEILEREKIDAVISDILMPRMDGYRLCMELRQHAELQNLPIILYTASYTSAADEAFALDLGADKFIRKPASAQVLADVLREVTTQARYRQPRLIRLTQKAEVLKLYSERLVSKLEERNILLTAQTASLTDSQQKLDAIIQSVDGIVWECDAHTFQVTFVSQQAERLLGYACERWIKEENFWVDHIHPEDREQTLNFCIKATAEKKNFELDYRMLAADGRVFWFRDIVTVVLETNRPTKLRGLLVNITERKQAQEEILRINASLEERVQQRTAQLQVANQELAAFSYSVSHDLRSPLNTIHGFGNLLDKEIIASGASERSKHYLDRIRAGTVQMGELIDALLSLALVAQTNLRRDSVDLSAMAQTVLSGYQEREPRRAVQLDIQPGLLVQGDPSLLLQVLANLLGNAWKFSAKQAHSKISFGHEKNRADETLYFVRDNGAGFDMAYSDKLFSPFQRLHSVSEFVGTGIGLAIVHKIIMRHGGKVWAESTPGHGATFYFTLLGDKRRVSR
jgi:PAS domain S-box-containing protein